MWSSVPLISLKESVKFKQFSFRMTVCLVRVTGRWLCVCVFICVYEFGSPGL